MYAIRLATVLQYGDDVAGLYDVHCASSTSTRCPQRTRQSTCYPTKRYNRHPKASDEASILDESGYRLRTAINARYPP